MSVVVLAVLHLLLGILLLIGAFALMAIGLIVPEVFPHMPWFAFRLAFRSDFIGVCLLFFALVDFPLAYGLWSGRGWAWFVSMVLTILGIALLAFSLFVTPRVGEVISLVIDLAIVYLLLQPRVKAYFGRGTVVPA